MLDVNGATSEGGQEVNLRAIEEIVILPLEPGVWLGLNLKLNVAGLNARDLITFAREIDLLSILHTSVDVNVQHLAFDGSLLALAGAAPILVTDHLAFAVAIWADGLESLNHRPHLAHHQLDTTALTASAFLDSAFLSSSSVTGGADDALL